MGLFYLLAVYCLLRGADGPHARRWNLLCVAACAFGMAMKEVMATAPVVCLLIDRALISGSFGRLFKERWRVHAGTAATWCVLLVILMGSPRSDTAGFSNAYVTAGEYAATQSGVILHYLRLAFWPDGLCLDYWWPIATNAREIVPPALVLGGLFVATLVRMMRGDDARSSRFRIATLVLGVVAVALIGATRHRNLAYYDREVLWRDVLSHRPENPRAHMSLGTVLRSKGDIDGALVEYRRVMELMPEDVVLLNYVGAILAEKAVAQRDAGHRTEAQSLFHESIARFRKAIELDPEHLIARETLGNVLREMGEFAAAEVEHRRAIELVPSYGDAYYNLGLDLAGQGGGPRRRSLPIVRR